MRSAALRDEFKHGWLCESHDQLRRFAPIPLNWQELPIEDLRILCLQAERAAQHH